MSEKKETLWNLLGYLFKAHPWHGIPIGGLRMIDGGEADDKIIAVMKGDAAFNRWREIEDSPNRMIDRLRHYFLTYKQAPQSDEGTKTEITHVYGREEAYEVIRRAHNDYSKRFSRLESLLEDALAGE